MTELTTAQYQARTETLRKVSGAHEGGEANDWEDVGQSFQKAAQQKQLPDYYNQIGASFEQIGEHLSERDSKVVHEAMQPGDHVAVAQVLDLAHRIGKVNAETVQIFQNAIDQGFEASARSKAGKS